MVRYFKKLILFFFSPLTKKLDFLTLQALIGNSISKVGSSTLRVIDKTLPNSWEFSSFSQNGEDGIIDYLISNLQISNRYFIEIGCSNGIENNTAFLAFVKKYSGLWIDGDQEEIEIAKKIAPFYVKPINLFVDKDNLATLNNHVLVKNPDVLSLDIDGNDYYILKMLLEDGYNPKILVVEYNSAFGPENSITIKYNQNFNMYKSKFPFLYYGVSIIGWINLLEKYNYKFVTVENNGVNAFFVDESCYEKEFLNNLSGLRFKENIHQRNYFKKTWEHQFQLIEDEEFFKILRV